MSLKARLKKLEIDQSEMEETVVMLHEEVASVDEIRAKVQRLERDKQEQEDPGSFSGSVKS